MFPTKDNPLMYEMKKQADIQDVLKRVDPVILLEKISRFRKLNIRYMSDLEISQAIFNVLCWDGYFAYYTNIKQYPIGTKFFRVKRLHGTKVPNSRFGIYDDYWETKAEYLKEYGRLNKPGEPLLYVCPDLYCAIKEVRIDEGELFAAIKYTAKSDVKVNMIGGEFEYKQMGIVDEKVQLVHEIYNGFLRDEFSRDVGKGTEYLYRISERIAKDYFDLPPRIAQDAWAYSSVQDKIKYNVCFRPDVAHDILKLDGAMICKVDSAMNIQVCCVAVGADAEGNILFYQMGTERQKEVFPEILYNDK